MYTKKMKIKIRIKLINSYNLNKNSLNLLEFSLFIEELKPDILVSQKYRYCKYFSFIAVDPALRFDPDL